MDAIRWLAEEADADAVERVIHQAGDDDGTLRSVANCARQWHQYISRPPEPASSEDEDDMAVIRAFERFETDITQVVSFEEVHATSPATLDVAALIVRKHQNQLGGYQPYLRWRHIILSAQRPAAQTRSPSPAVPPAGDDAGTLQPAAQTRSPSPAVPPADADAELFEVTAMLQAAAQTSPALPPADADSELVEGPSTEGVIDPSAEDDTTSPNTAINTLSKRNRGSMINIAKGANIPTSTKDSKNRVLDRISKHILQDPETNVLVSRLCQRGAAQRQFSDGHALAIIMTLLDT